MPLPLLLVIRLKRMEASATKKMTVTSHVEVARSWT